MGPLRGTGGKITGNGSLKGYAMMSKTRVLQLELTPVQVLAAVANNKRKTSKGEVQRTRRVEIHVNMDQGCGNEPERRNPN